LLIRRCSLLLACLALWGCGSQAPPPASSQTSKHQALSESARALGRTTGLALRVPIKGGVPRAYRLGDLSEVDNAVKGRLPAIERIIGLDPEAAELYVIDLKQTVLGLALESGRLDTIMTSAAAATLGPDGTLYAVDQKHHVVSLERRERLAWSQALDAAPRDLFGAGNARLIAVLSQEPPKLVTAAADQPPASRQISIGGDVAVTRWGDLLAVASDSGVTLMDPLSRRAPAFVPLADHPRALAFSPSGHRVYVARRNSPGLAVIDRFTRQEIDGVALPEPAAAIRLDPYGRWLLAKPGALDSAWVVDLPIKRLVGGIATTWRSDLPDVAPDGTLLAREGADVVAYNPDSLKRLGKVADGAADLWLLTAWTPRGAYRGASALPTSPVASGDTAAPGAAMYIQVSVSQNATWSAEMADQLTRAGLSAKVLPPANPDDGYRVVLGPYATREEAEAIGRKLGRPFWIYQPGQ